MKSFKLLFILLLMWDGSEVFSARAKKRKVDEFVKIFRKRKVTATTPIPKEDIAPFLGHGGTFESVQPWASKDKTIESDHAPHNSILEYVDPKTLDRLPENIKNAVKKRKDLEADLATTAYSKNEAKMKDLEPQIKAKMEELEKLVPVSTWEASLQKEYKENIKKMKNTQRGISRLEAELESKPTRDPASKKLETLIAGRQRTMKTLLKKITKLREKAKAPIKTRVDDELKVLEGKYMKLESENALLSKPLRDHNEHIRDAMGVLSIPYDKHRNFPSTGSGGLKDDIRNLKDADSAAAKEKMKEYGGYWKKAMDEGIKFGYLRGADKIPKLPGGGYDYDAIWKRNFKRVIKAVENEKAASGKPSKGKPRDPKEIWEEAKQKFLKRVHLNYAKKFMTTAIYYLKRPGSGYSRLVQLYIDEYKLYMKNDFDNYKHGISKLLEANEQFGWLTKDDVKKIRKLYKLPKAEDLMDASTSDPVAAKRAKRWNAVEELVKLESEGSSNPVIPDKTKASTPATTGAGTVCSTSKRKKRSLSSGGSGYDCIFYSKQKESEVDHEKEKDPHSHLDEDGLPKPKIRLPSDEDTVSIDSKRLTSYLDDLGGDDIHSVRTKQAVVEYASKNADKLTGSSEEVAAAKARLQQEDLDIHSEKTSLGTKLLRENPNEISVSPKTVTKYKQMKISSSRMAVKLGKFTSATSKFSNPYGKIMLAKGIVTALRHGDYESLALMGGRIGLEFALHGVTKLGTKIAEKATTKFMTKFGSRFLGELAGPVGAIADIGINIYSITKSVKVLNDPTASKFDRNDAIADIVADSIDIAVTATATVLSLVFPPLAPVFAAVAFIVNLFTTVVVGFYKAANNVDRINAELPLLDHEKSREYWRYVRGDDTSGYIQELIDTKKANNAAVNTTVQFLKNNTEFIGRVFPSRTFYQPGTPCWLEEKHCWKIMFFIPACGDWYWVSDCNGAGGYCSGRFSSTKCQWDSGTGFVLPLTIFAGMDTWEHRCRCGNTPNPEWGDYDELDNEVDLRSKQNVHLQRAAPDFLLESGFTYLCKPSTLTDEGERVSRPETEWAYHCKAAIGVTRSNNVGKFMRYDLGNGTDSVYLDTSEKVDNLFVVNDGHKQFEGNAGDDTFILDGPCNSNGGWLDGKGYKENGNTLVLGSDCSSGGRLEVDLHSGNLHFGGYSLGLRNIQRVFGRKSMSDTIHADCSTKLIVDQGGGSPSDPDEIYLPSSCATDTELIVAVAGSATVHGTSTSGGKCLILLQDKGLSLNAKVSSSLPKEAMLLFKFQENVGKLTSASTNSINNGATIELKFDGGGTATFEISETEGHKDPGKCQKPSDENQIQILLAENTKFSRHLSFSLAPQRRLQAIHGLTNDEGTNSIQGYDFIDNVFYLISGQWNVVGGQGKMNQFILKSMDFSGSIDGTSSGQNILVIKSDFNMSPISIDFESGAISPGHLKSGEGKVFVKNIQRLVGRPDFIEEVQVLCTKQHLELGGSVRDFVNIPGSDCGPEVRISAKGMLTLEDRKSSGTTIIDAGYFDPCVGRSGERLDLEILNYGEGDMILLLNFPISAVTAASPALLNVGGEGGGQVVINGSFPNVYLEEDYSIKSALLPDDSGKLLAYHQLNVTDTFQQIPKSRKGTNVVPNIFKLENGKNWRVEGGNEGDAFSFSGEAFSGSIFGMGGRNQLHIAESIQGDVKIKQSELLLRGQRAFTFEGIQEIHGRVGQSEVVEVGCDTSLLALNGSNLLKPDQIIIPESFSSCNSNLSLTVSAVGFTQLDSVAVVNGNVDTYLATDAYNRLQFKAHIQVSPNLKFNFPIELPSYKLSSYQLSIRRVNHSKTIESVRLNISLMDEANFLEFTLKGDYHPENITWMFVDEEYNSNGNIFMNTNSDELFVLHILQKEGDDDKTVRKGAVGAKNIFRLHTGTWEAFGGALDDSFILIENGFQGQIHGLQGVNTLILNETLEASLIEIDLAEQTLLLDRRESLSIKSIQIVGGRKGKKEIVDCGCDTKLIMLDGGEANQGYHDEIFIKDQPCTTEMDVTVVITNFTMIQNSATKGNFTYQVNATESSTWDIRYIATAHTNHVLKLEMSLENVKEINMTVSSDGENDDSRSLEITFVDGGTKQFPLNLKRPPILQIGNGHEPMAEILFPGENMTEPSPRSSIIAKTPFSEIVHGINGVYNGISVKTANSLQGIFGGDKGDNIFLSEVESVLVIKAGKGVDRLHLSDELHRGLDMEVDFQLEKITFVETGSDFVTWVKGIDLFVGREHSFERVVLGCGTRSVKWAEEVSIRNSKCGYDVKIELGDSTRVMFEWMDLDDEVVQEEEKDEEEKEICSKDDDDKSSESCNREEEDLDSDDESAKETYLEHSVFHYHFTSIRSFDIEVDSFESLWNTTHIFYLNFHLADLKSIRFSLNESRLIYSTLQDPSLEYSHLVGKLEDTAMFYSQPEFMTKEGFLLRITRYGEVKAVLGAWNSTFELDFIHQTIPVLTAQSERLGIGFILETATQFIYAGSTKNDEVDILTNRVNTTSHLIGWNGTTYEIIDMESDTWIHPQQTDVQDALHVIDLSNIVFQIRNWTGLKYIPEVRENGPHLEIMLTGFTEKHPGNVIIANGTEHVKSLVILLNSIAMEIIPEELVDKPVGGMNKWKIKPRTISVPMGHSYVLAAEDLEDNVVTKIADGTSGTLIVSRNNFDLVITGVDTQEDLTAVGRFTSFVIFDFYESGNLHMDDGNGNRNDPFGSVDAVRNLRIDQGPETIRIASHFPIVKEKTGQEVPVEDFEDTLISIEEEILKDFPDMSRRFKKSAINTATEDGLTISHLRDEL